MRSLLSFTLLLCVGNSYAAQIDWLNPANGSFGDSSNWSGAVIPTAADDVSFATGGADYFVDFSSNRETDSAVVRDQYVFWELQNNSYDLAGSDGLQVWGTSSRDAELAIRQGTLDVMQVGVGNVNAVNTGDSGDGWLRLENNTTLTTDTLRLGRNDIGSLFSEGRLNISSGSSLTTSTIEAAYARVELNGIGSSLNSSSVQVGGITQNLSEGASFDVRAGAFADLGNISLDSINGGVEFVVGGTDSVLVLDTVTADNGYVGISVVEGTATSNQLSASGSTTSMEIRVSESDGSFTNNGSLDIRGRLDVSFGAEFVNVGDANFGDGSRISVRGAGSTWTNNGDIELTGSSLGPRSAQVLVEVDGLIDASGATVTANEFSQVAVDGGTIQADQLIFAGGALLGKGDIVADVFVGDSGFIGTVSPGVYPGLASFDRIGTLNIDGDYTQASTGNMFLELSGLLPGTEHDSLAISGTASLNGSLEIALLSGYTPELGDIFDLLTATNINGSFDSILLPELSEGLFWQLDYVIDSGDIDVFKASVVPIPAGFWLFLSAFGWLGWWKRKPKLMA